MWSSYLYHWEPYTGKTASLYWEGPMSIIRHSIDWLCNLDLLQYISINNQPFYCQCHINRRPKLGHNCACRWPGGASPSADTVMTEKLCMFLSKILWLSMTGLIVMSQITKAISWSNVDLPLMRPFGIHLQAWEVLTISICKIKLKNMLLKWLPYPRGQWIKKWKYRRQILVAVHGIM